MLALVATALMALGAGALPAPSGSKPVLAYASSPAATERPASWASAFRAMVARDLRGAGVFRLLEPAAEASPEGAPPRPGGGLVADDRDSPRATRQGPGGMQVHPQWPQGSPGGQDVRG